MSAGYRIGVRGCQHLGYAASGMRAHKRSHWNQRIHDGHYAHEATMRSMIEHGVDGIVDGGDLTHFNKPLPRDVEAANKVDDLRAAAGIWGIGNSGNHCAGGGNDISAMGVMHRPAMGMSAVYPDPLRRAGDGVGPFPGLYEIHTSETNSALPDGLALHMVSHYGLSRFLPEAGITIDPTPLPGHVNLFFSHGVFQADERLYQCVNPHGEERPIPPEWATRGWDAMLLSHYHTLGAVPGYGDGERGQVWYTGSSLRRGFSDEAGVRGWLRVTIADTGHVRIDVVPIWQRPQIDLPVIDATDLSTTDLDDLITANVSAISLTDAESGDLTDDPGVILRQRIANTTGTQRRALAGLRGRYLSLTEPAAWWSGLVFDGAVMPEVTRASQMPRLDWSTARTVDFSADLRGRYERLRDAVQVPTQLHEPVLHQTLAWTNQISPAPNTAEADTTAPSPSADGDVTADGDAA